MSVGLLVSKQEIDQRMGDISRAFQGRFNDVLVLQAFLVSQDDQAMMALGYTAAEVDLMRSAFGDLVQLGLIWTGEATLLAEKDFRVYVRQLWGVGSF